MSIHPTQDWVMRLFPKPGYFVEAGAHNGVGDSQTKYLEDSGWTGICVEPSAAYHGLVESRKCKTDNRCLWSKCETVAFRQVRGNGIELSGIEKCFCDSHDRRDGDIVQKETVSLTSLLRQHQAPRTIQFMELDTEGSEYEILAAHDFDAYPILALAVEHNGVARSRERICALLESKGYVLDHGNEIEDYYLHSSYWEKDPDGVPRFRHAEVEICTICDCNCWGCDRFVDVHPGPEMSLAQVKHFVSESLALNWNWKRLHILGGEPTLHREFKPICEEFLRYRDNFPNVLLRVISNGHGKLGDYRDWLAEKEIACAVEQKQKNQLPGWFLNTRRAPMDMGQEYRGPLEPCGIFGIEGCGLGVTRHGIFLCGAGAAVARMIGADIGILSLADATYAAMLEQAKKLCHLCGHWNGPDTIARKIVETGKIMSPFWQETLADWKPSPMSLYGE